MPDKKLKLNIDHIMDASRNRINTNKLSDISSSNDGVVSKFEETAMNLNNLFTKKQIDSNRFTKFSRFGLLDPYHTNTFSREYLFFTRTDLNIFQSDGTLNPALQNNNYFSGAVLTNKRSLECLQDTNMKNSKNRQPTWNFLLSNQVSSNLDMPAATAEMTQHNQNLYGISQSFRDSSRATEYSFEFNLEFNDTEDHDVYHFFKAYNEYCNLEYERDLLPHKKYLEYPNRYKEFSIYKVVVNDYNKIIYYGKHIGVTIKALPSDAMNDHEGPIKFSVPMHTFHAIEFNPYILAEINLLSSRAAGDFGNSTAELNAQLIPSYNKEYNTANKDWAAVPFIQAEVINGKYIYYLKWRKVNV